MTPPRDFLLPRDYCSYGYFHLPPHRWDASALAAVTVQELPDGPALVRITQPAARAGGKGDAVGAMGATDMIDKGDVRALAGRPLKVVTDRPLSAADRADLRSKLTRMLRLDETAEHLAAFHAVDSRWKRDGRGRLMRSPTLFEDIIKTVTSCNVTWPGTINMNRRLCAVYGRAAPSARELDERLPRHTFPEAAKLARVRPASLRGRCGVGYRDTRIVELARMFARDQIDEAWLADPATSGDEVRKFLLALPGVGPYAAANIMQLLGRYDHVALDSEALRHGREALGLKGTDAAVMRKVAAHYATFGEHAFRSYWLSMWVAYEAKAGAAWTWER